MKGPTAPDAVGPFYFLLGVWVLYHVWGESARSVALCKVS
jgi:hypothetical protein